MEVLVGLKTRCQMLGPLSVIRSVGLPYGTILFKGPCLETLQEIWFSSSPLCCYKWAPCTSFPLKVDFGCVVLPRFTQQALWEQSWLLPRTWYTPQGFVVLASCMLNTYLGIQ